MRASAIPAGLLAVLALTGSARAQAGESERGGLVYFQAVKLLPADARAYEAAMGKMRTAAQLADLGAEYRWAYINEAFTYTLIFPFADFSYWNDPQQWLRRIQGTEGEALLQEAIQAFYDLDTRVVASEVLERLEAWTYEAAGAREPMAGAHITEFWVKSGKEPQFGQLVEDMVAFLGELEYPYPVVGYRVHFGDSGRMVFVTWFDDRASYYGENNLQKLIGEKNAFERWSQLRGRLPELVLDIREHDAIFRPRMSYWPEVEASSR